MRDLFFFGCVFRLCGTRGSVCVPAEPSLSCTRSRAKPHAKMCIYTQTPAEADLPPPPQGFLKKTTMRAYWFFSRALFILADTAGVDRHAGPPSLSCIMYLV